VLVAALIACAAPTGSSAPEIILEPTVRPTLGQAALATLAAPTLEPPVSATGVASSAFRDDFDGTMDLGWSWFKSPEPGYSLTHTPGWLRLNLSPGSFFGATAPENVLIRPAPGGDFDLTTYLRFSPHNNFELAGLAVMFDDTSILQFGRGFCYTDGTSPACLGDGLYFDNIQNGAPVGGNFSTPAALGLDYVLRLQRQGSTYTASSSTDGANWTTLGSHTVDKVPASIGLIAAQSTVASPYADFDYFEMTSGS
jgi:beta-xylosidase